MMMRIAGGPGATGVLDFSQRKRPVPRWMWLAIGTSLLVHGGAGFWLYQQKFQPPAPPVVENPPVTEVELFRLPLPPAPLPQVEPLRDPPPVHRPTLVETPPLTLPVTPVETPNRDWTLEAPLTVPPVETSVDVAAGAGAVEASPPAVIVNPRLIARPTPEQLRRAYPTRAMAGGVEGSAVMQCEINARGGLTACSVLSETPAGQGFGRAAQQLSRHFRVSPRTVDGQATEGARVNIPLTFRLD